MSFKKVCATGAINYNYNNNLTLHWRYVEAQRSVPASCNNYITRSFILHDHKDINMWQLSESLHMSKLDSMMTSEDLVAVLDFDSLSRWVMQLQNRHICM